MTIYTIVVTAVAFLLAYLWSKADSREIERRNASEDYRELDHRALLAWRITVLAIGLCISFACLRWLGSPDWKLIPTACLAWGVFVPSHRFLLNKWRGFDWRYLSTGNNYDLFWMKVSEYTRSRMWVRNDVLNPASVAFVRREPFFNEAINHWMHRAAMFAYSFESIITLASAATILFA